MALIANYYDKTLLRCSYAEYLNHNIFLDSENLTTLGWNPSYVHVDVIMNGEYIGNYTLAERIKIEEKRINIKDISKDLENGGFVCEINERADEKYNFRTDWGESWLGKYGLSISLKDPDEVSVEVRKKVREIVQEAEDSLFSNNFSDSENGYAKYFDLNSLVDWYIMHEYIRMEDATVFYTSAYFYYDPNDKKNHMGPCWDYDTGAGNTTNNLQPEGFDLKMHATWYARLFEDENFVNLVKTRWNEKKLDLATTISNIQNKADEIKISADYTFIRWDVLGKQTGLNADGWETRTTYQSELDFMIDWLNRRVDWLDTNLNAL